MKLIGIKKFTAPNLWSDSDSIMTLIVDTKKFRNAVIYNDDDFSYNLKVLFPHLYDRKQTFLYNILNGIPIEDIIGPVIRELMAQAGYYSQNLRTTHICDGIYQVPFTYTNERAAIQSGIEAVRIVEALALRKKGKTLNIRPDREYQSAIIPVPKNITIRPEASK